MPAAISCPFRTLTRFWIRLFADAQRYYLPPLRGVSGRRIVIRRFLGLLGFILLMAACGPDSAELRNRAGASWRDGDYREAIRLNLLLYKSDSRGSYAPQALLNIGDIYYLNLRQLKNAIDSYNKLVEEFPGKPETLKARGQLAAIYENEIGDLTQAIFEYDKILEADNPANRAEIRYKRANAFFRQEDFDRAWRELRRIEESGEGDAHLLDQISLRLGDIEQIRHRYQEAADYFKKASTSACPECRRRAILNLTETYEALYDYDRAIETIRKLDHSPEDDQRVSREVARLREKKRRVNKNAISNLEYPRTKARKKIEHPLPKPQSNLSQ